ncbi:HD domain-containing protein [Melioribacteraceae bacterium 4301-Me]|uniref:[protein-PII] uridylyltransferase family protein n=1 Tax=Pyranulibacter aquaticus TaxID=3163344 RepID=UPI003597C290
MNNVFTLKEQFLKEKSELFSNTELLKNPFKFCVTFSLMVERYVQLVLKGKRLKCAVAAVGSFSRRELSPYSDIDIMFIYSKVDGNEDVIKECVTELWDCGIEVSHTVREYKDIKKFLKEDLHAFTQFFETRYIIGSRQIYDAWIGKVLSALNNKYKKELIEKFFNDINARYTKYGDSAKVLEPNVKFTAGGLRDLQIVEWIYSLKNDILLSEQSEITQTEVFLNLVKKNKIILPRAAARLYESYKLILATRNFLHLLSGHKNDRLEFSSQEKIARFFDYGENTWHSYMKKYFEAANVIKRFNRTMMKRFEEEITNPISDMLSIDLDEDFVLKGNNLTKIRKTPLTFSSIMRAFYYYCLYDAQFDEQLRSEIIEAVFDHEETQNLEMHSSVFFREILKLPKNVGKTLYVMNELGVLGIFLPEFKDLIGFFQPGVYHCYTADEHTLIALNNLEKLINEESFLGKLFASTKNKDVLYLAVLFHDIAKPISISGHEIIGAEVANSVMERLGYDQNEITLVQFLVRHHLTMEQVAFRRNLNDSTTLDNFVKIFPSLEALDLLYLLTYADLSAVSPVVWTQWKGDLLYELYSKTKRMLVERISGEELLSYTTQEILRETKAYSEESFRQHIDQIDDIGYLQNFSQDEINQHIEEIEKGSPVSVFFKEVAGFTNVTVITKDSASLLSRLCGALSINDLNIHDAKIFTRKDGIVIDSFNVTDFRTGGVIDEAKYPKIISDLNLAVENELQITKEFSKIKSKWWRIENKLFKRKGKVKIEFEKHDKYTIIDVYSPDRLGLLYQVTKKMNELGLSIYFAKIATKADDVVDAFYVLDHNRKKISTNNYQLITVELTQTIEEML